MAPNDRSPVRTTPNPAQDSACPCNVTAGRVMSRCGLACLGPCRKQRCRQVDPGGPLQRWAHHTPSGAGRCDAMLQLGRMPSRTLLRRRLAPSGPDAAATRHRGNAVLDGADAVSIASPARRARRGTGYAGTCARAGPPARGYLHAGTCAQAHARTCTRAGTHTRRHAHARASARRGAHTRARARERERKPGGGYAPPRARIQHMSRHISAHHSGRGA